MIGHEFLEAKVNDDENEDGKYHVPHERNGGGVTGVPDTLYLEYPVDVQDYQNETYSYSPETNSHDFALWFSHKEFLYCWTLPMRTKHEGYGQYPSLLTGAIAFCMMLSRINRKVKRKMEISSHFHQSC
jgi:hypothetical protein